MKFISPEEQKNLHRNVGEEQPRFVQTIPSEEAILLPGKVTTGLDLKIDLFDLPKAWQEHVAKRKMAGLLDLNKNTFTKEEILRATSDPDSFTDPEIVDKIFDRVKKEKINFKDLPLPWQEFLKGGDNPITNYFDDVTVEYLFKRGALPDDIAKIRERLRSSQEVSPKTGKVTDFSGFPEPLSGEGDDLVGNSLPPASDFGAKLVETLNRGTSRPNLTEEEVRHFTPVKEGVNHGWWKRQLESVKSFSRHLFRMK